MYAKIFTQIFSSSIVEESIEIRYVWMCLLVLSDQEGIIDMTIPSIARRINVNEDLVEKAIQKFMQPDASSRTPTQDGKRLEKIRDTFGWKIINYIHYRNLRDEETRREYMRSYMRSYMKEKRLAVKQKKFNKSLILSNVKHCLAQADTEADTDTDTKRYSSSFALFWENYPRKVGKATALKSWLKLKPNNELIEKILTSIQEYRKTTQWQDKQYIPHPASWLNAKRWEDEIEDDTGWGPEFREELKQMEQKIIKEKIAKGEKL